MFIYSSCFVFILSNPPLRLENKLQRFKSEEMNKISLYNISYISRTADLQKYANTLPIVGHSEPCHRHILTLCAKMEEEEKEGHEGGDEGELSPCHDAQLVSFH